MTEKNEKPVDVYSDQLSDEYWNVYNTALAQYPGGNRTFQLTAEQIRQGGESAVREACRDAKERGLVPASQADPVIKLLEVSKPKPPQHVKPPKPERSYWEERRRRKRIRGTILGAGIPAVVIGGLALGIGGWVHSENEPGAKVTTSRPVPDAAAIADMKARTLNACDSVDAGSDYKPQNGVNWVAKNRYQVNRDFNRLVLYGKNVQFVVPPNVKVDNLYFCSKYGDLEVISKKIGFLGVSDRQVQSGDSIEISGAVDSVFDENQEQGSTTKVSGHVGDFVLHSNNSGGRDVNVTDGGRIENAIESNEGHVFAGISELAALARSDGTVSTRNTMVGSGGHLYINVI